MKTQSALCLCLAAVSAPAHAAGFRIEGQDARAVGAATAGAAARSGDAGLAFYNPAGLAGVARFDGSGTISGLFIDSDYSDAQGVLLGAFPVSGASAGEGVLPDAFIPSAGFGVRLGERLVIGMTLNAPFGLSADYDAGSALRYHAQKSELKTLAATPMAAFNVTPGLSVGVGLRIQYADLSLTAVADAAGVAGAFSLGAYMPGTEDVYSEFTGDDIGVGVVAGAQARLAPGLMLGVSFSSKIEHDFDGETVFDLAGSTAGEALASLGFFETGPASTGFATPAVIEVGAVLAVNERLDLLAGAALTRWRVFDRVVIEFDNPAQPAETLTQDWNDAWSVSLGAEYKANERTALRAGVMFDDSPLNPAVASPRITDADRFWLSAGLSRSLTDRWSADIGGAVVFFDQARYSLPDTLPETVFRGSLEATVNARAYILSARLRRSY